MFRNLGERKYCILVFNILFLLFLSACNGVTPTSPIINFFTADSTYLAEGESVTLYWAVNDATDVTISPGIGAVALSGPTSVTPTETTTYTLTATNGAESSTDSLTIIVEKTLTIQPGPTEGKDSYVNGLKPDFNYASADYLSFGQESFTTLLGIDRDKISFNTYLLRAFLQFDLSELPADAVIVSASLGLFSSDDLEGILTFSVHQVIQDWQESTITWNNQPDYSLGPEDKVTINTGYVYWLYWDLTALVQGWVNGSIANYGVALQDDGNHTEFIALHCYSSDYTNPEIRPKLEITYYIP